MLSSLSREHDGLIARVTYDNAARGNSFTDQSLRDLADVVEQAAAEPSCRVVRLDLTGAHFCGGWDTSSFGDLGAAPVEDVAAALRASDEQLARIRALPVPIVSAVRGKVVGFGAGLLGAIHLPVAAREVRLTLPEVWFGFAPAGVGHLVAQTLPRAQAYGLLTGTVAATAEDLHAWGLVTRVVPDARLDEEVDELVEKLVSAPGDVLRAVVTVVESSRRTGRPDDAYLAAAHTIVAAAAGHR